MKNIWILIFVIITSSCSTAVKEPLTPDSSIPSTPLDPSIPIDPSKPIEPSIPLDPSSPNYLEELDKRYPYLPIKLKPFEVADKDSSFSGASDEENKEARKIDIKEKEYMLKHLDLLRFVVNTPEFEKEVFLEVHKFRVGRDAKGAYGTIKEGDYYNKTKLLALLKHASITTYIRKDALSPGTEGLGKAGPSYYVDVDLDNNPSKGPWNTDALIMFPNNSYWASSEFGYGQEFPHNIEIVGLMLHELMHNLGTKHGAVVSPEDTAVVMHNVFRATTSEPEWRNKYRKQVKEYKYYQTKYKDFLISTTTPASR